MNRNRQADSVCVVILLLRTFVTRIFLIKKARNNVKNKETYRDLEKGEDRENSIEKTHVCITSNAHGCYVNSIAIRKFHSRKGRIEMMTTLHTQLYLYSDNQPRLTQRAACCTFTFSFIWRLIRNLVASKTTHTHVANGNGMCILC